MTDEDKLKEYMRENALKEPKRKSPPAPAAPKKVKVKSPRSFFYWREIGDAFTLIFYSGLTSLLVYAGVYMYVGGNFGGDTTPAVISAWCFWAGVSLFAIGSMSYNMYMYNNLIKNEYYKLTGWNDFFIKRTEFFWTRRNYTTIKVTFRLAPNATKLQSDSVRQFTKKAVEKWKKRYEGIDWEPGYGQPKDLTSSGTSLTGEFSSAELTLLVKILMKFVPLAHLLGKYLEEVVVESNGEEHLIKTKKVSRNAYDRQSSRGD